MSVYQDFNFSRGINKIQKFLTRRAFRRLARNTKNEIKHNFRALRKIKTFIDSNPIDCKKKNLKMKDYDMATLTSVRIIKTEETQIPNDDELDSSLKCPIVHF